MLAETVLAILLLCFSVFALMCFYEYGRWL